ncbi:hypothetical protein HMPREF9136_1123 [Prevotella dentalis DSM 3688]|uniref:Uncharacterized protein n=1 Tax=Prevotella dentalis (strain ATCC 49559 / DSM 3688 / JCM 13448 / NCTC 12043 / ES 2772) TaxID=908937 RepID=F9D2P5_PREDD|nr:hypothetical protein HMPREF9136_1123 [Prevotella dentalis DSM 3688]
MWCYSYSLPSSRLFVHIANIALCFEICKRIKRKGYLIPLIYKPVRA